MPMELNEKVNDESGSGLDKQESGEFDVELESQPSSPSR